MKQEIIEQLEKIENIATIPGNAFQIIQLINDPDSSLNAISKLIEQDMSLTTKILKIANSPFIGYISKVDTVQRALTILGLNQVKNMVLAIALYSAFVNFKETENFSREKFWQHSFGTGQIARTFANKLNIHMRGEEFVGGVIHDVGKIIIDQYFPEKFEEILKYSKDNQMPLIESEQKILGADHMEIGGWILKKWQFPENLISVVSYHHNPSKSEKHQELVSIIQISEVFCELWGVGFDDDVKTCVIEELEGWKILQNLISRLKGLDIEMFTMELYQEMSKALEFFKIAQS
ncbi:MAG: HDOD domain-containing protein [Calditrichia bacterium]|nr:HDOD domain-containing protein [Calditrichia bacterium]